jgi:hypothetical protein
MHGVPALDALSEGFDVYPMVDAIAGTSVEAHRARHLITWVAFAEELQRDWARPNPERRRHPVLLVRIATRHHPQAVRPRLFGAGLGGGSVGATSCRHMVDPSWRTFP